MTVPREATGPGTAARRAVGAVDRRLRRLERGAHRHLLAVGDRVHCPVCGWSGVGFAASHKPRRMNRICPRCASSERDRALELWLGERPVRQGAKVLEVAPLGLLAPTARRLGYHHVSMDLSSPRADVLADLCALPFPDGAFDVVVCFHVLEHVPRDLDAVAQIARVLHPGGRAVISVPWMPQLPVTEQDPSASPAERQRRFGQSDHVRNYGRDTTDRFRSGGLAVEERPWRTLFSDEQFRRHALDGDDDRFWIATAS